MKWQQKVENKFFNEIYAVYITFLSMDTTETIFKLYNKAEGKRRGWIADYIKTFYDQRFRKKFAITHSI